MYILTVIPIGRGINTDELSYFSKDKPPIGSILSIPVRNRKILGLVLEVKDAESEKSRLRNAPYEMKKVDADKAKEIFSSTYIRSAKKMSEFYVCATGAVLWGTLPHNIIEQSDNLLSYKQAVEIISASRETINENMGAKHSVIRGTSKVRANAYRSHIRSCFAKKRSVFVSVPTIEDAEQIKEMLSKGIEPYTVALHSEISKKNIVQIWNEIASKSHPMLIIGTSNFLSIPRPDIGLIIIERESSRAYRMNSRPYLDYRRMIETFAEMIGADLIRGDTVLTTETWWRAEKNEFNSEFHEDTRNFEEQNSGRIQVIDMAKYKLEEGKPFRVISDELDNLIERSIKNRKKLFIFTPRKGLYPTTICSDCNKIVSCDECSAPLVIHAKNQEDNKNPNSDEYIFICHHCGNERSTEIRCENCNSWRLASLGVGIERVALEIEKKYPEMKVLTLDKKTEPNKSRVKNVIEEWQTSLNCILIGTEYALAYVNDADHSAISSLDSLMLVPDFRMQERILNIILTLASKTAGEMLVQTRDPSDPIFSDINKKTLREFYAREIEDRRMLDYPPFSFYIKISRMGKKENVEHDLKMLKNKLGHYDMTIIPARIEKVKGQYIMHLIIKLRPKDWPDQTITSILKSLPPSFSIKVDPESLL